MKKKLSKLINFADDPKKELSVIQDISKIVDVDVANNFKKSEPAVDMAVTFLSDKFTPIGEDLLSKGKSFIGESEFGKSVSAYTKDKLADISKAFGVEGGLISPETEAWFEGKKEWFDDNVMPKWDAVTSVEVKGQIEKLKNLTEDGKLDAVALSGIVSELSGNSELAKAWGMEEKMGMISTMVDTAIALGVPNLIDAVVDLVGNALDTPDMWLEVVLKAGRAGDIDTWEKYITYLVYSPISPLKDHKYEVVESIFRGYYRGWKNKTSYKKIGEQLLDTIESFWPDWDICPKRKVVSLDFYIMATYDVKMALCTTSKRPHALAARNFFANTDAVVIGLGFPQLTNW